MKNRLMALMLVAGGALFAAPRVSIGVQIGGPVMIPTPAPVIVNAYRPPCPGPGYVWIEGYYDAYGNWYDGYWALPPYAGAYWIAPRMNTGHFVAGYWTGPRGVYRAAPRAAVPAYGHSNRDGFHGSMASRYQQPSASARGSWGGGMRQGRGGAGGGGFRR